MQRRREASGSLRRVRKVAVVWAVLGLAIVALVALGMILRRSP